MNVKIGALLFTVTEVPALCNETGERMDGRLMHGKTEISLDPELNEQAKMQTLLHEIVHELCIQYGLGLRESAVDRLAFGFYQVFRDNWELREKLGQ